MENNMSAKNIMGTIGNVNLNREDSGWISAQEVANHLANKLGFPIMCDFKKFGGTSPLESYVRMRVGMKDADCLMPADTNDVISKLLRNYGKSIPLKESVLNVLKPYMYPQDPQVLKQMILNVPPQRLVEIGLCGDNLKDIIKHAIPFHDTVHSYVGLYLRPEVILREMCIDPADDNPGTFQIDITDGNNERGIRWQVSIQKKATNVNNVITPDMTVTLDTIFNTSM